jgi:hypothetical protein
MSVYRSEPCLIGATSGRTNVDLFYLNSEHYIAAHIIIYDMIHIQVGIAAFGNSVRYAQRRDCWHGSVQMTLRILPCIHGVCFGELTSVLLIAGLVRKAQCYHTATSSTYVSQAPHG